MMDALKAQVAASVRNTVNEMWTTTGAEVYFVDDLNTVIRIKTPAGPRYFNVKVSEQI